MSYVKNAASVLQAFGRRNLVEEQETLFVRNAHRMDRASWATLAYSVTKLGLKVIFSSSFHKGMFVPLRRAQTWRLHTKLYKFGWHSSADNARMKNSRDLIFDKVVYKVTIYCIPASWIYLFKWLRLLVLITWLMKTENCGDKATESSPYWLTEWLTDTAIERKPTQWSTNRLINRPSDCLTTWRIDWLFTDWLTDNNKSKIMIKVWLIDYKFMLNTSPDLWLFL